MKNKQYIPILVVILLFLLALGAYGITFQKVSSLQKESFALDADIAALTNKEKGIAQAQQTLNALAAQEEKVNTHLVSDTTVVDFLNTVEGLQTTRDVVIDVVSVAAQDDAFVLNLTVEGPFQEVVQTIGALNNLQTQMTLAGASLSTIVKKENDSRLWSASLTYTVARNTL